MQKKYIYIIAFICVFIFGLLIGQGSTKGTIKGITDNLQSAENRVSELENSISGYRNTITELKRINSEQDDFIDKITKGFDDSRE